MQCSTRFALSLMSNRYGTQGEPSSHYYVSSTMASILDTARQQQQQQQQQQSQQPQQPSTVSQMDNLDVYGSENEKMMEMVGISPTTFSNNIQFEVPRFMRDAFDPAVTMLESSTSTQPRHTFSTDPSDLSVQRSGSSNPYPGPYTDIADASTSSYPEFHLPDLPVPPVYRSLPVTNPTPYGPPNPSSTVGINGPLSSTRPPPKPPRSSSLALNGLPIYSASGFDMLDILARVATRPQPKIQLGPVDMTCSFLVVDITRDDSPIIYASHTFTVLTGYPQSEILGRNCRFLQAPPGVAIEKGGSRPHTDMNSVSQMAQSVSQNRECQVTLVNYKRNGEAFVNCVSIIPIVSGGNEPVRYHVGFQVDLALQPQAILQSVQDGSYITNYSSTPLPPVLYQPVKLDVRALSGDMIEVLNKMGGSSMPDSTIPGETQDRQRLSMIFLSECPDAIFVVSLKGSFLYVSPSVSRLLGHDANYFLNKNLSDVCHPSDLAPTMRNIKESSVSPSTQTTTPAPAGQEIQLLFRARCADNTYIWLDCPGKLYSDTSRGRKALLLRPREIELPRMTWKAFNDLGGISSSDCYLRVARDDRGLVVACLRGVEDVLGKKSEELVGKTLSELVADDEVGTTKDEIKRGLRVGDASCGNLPDSKCPRIVVCNIQAALPSRSAQIPAMMNNGQDSKLSLATAELAFFPPLSMKPTLPDDPSEQQQQAGATWRLKPQTLVVRIRVEQQEATGSGPQNSMPISRSNQPSTSSDPNVLSSVHGSSAQSSMASFHAISNGFYGINAGDASIGAAASSYHSRLQIYGDSLPSLENRPNRKHGYQVRHLGDVNLIDDAVPSPLNRPSVPGSSSQPADTGGQLADSSMAPITSSWQYELQQLRMSNEKLRVDVAAAKKDHRKKQRESITFRSLARYDDTRQPAPGNITENPRQTPVAMEWPIFATSTLAGSSSSTSYPNMAMPPPPPPQTLSASMSASAHQGYDKNWTDDGPKTDMHPEWDRWNQ